MNRGRRVLLKGLGAGALATALPTTMGAAQDASTAPHSTTDLIRNGKMKLSFRPYELQLKHTFTVAGNSRDTTPVVLTEIQYEGLTGYGEASLPPYLGESQQSVMQFLSKVKLESFDDPFLLDEILAYVDSIEEGNRAAKACVDIALHDLMGKLVNQPLHRLWGINPANTPVTSFTIGIDTPEVVKMKTEEAARFKVLKVKLGGGNDREMIETVRSVTDVPIYVDVNQGWTDKQQALDMTHWLAEQGVEFVEQPLPKTAVEDLAWLTSKSPLPIIADEAFQRLGDVADFQGVYSGINIKLMKSTGLREAQKMITVARALDMKVMIGCMTETSCAVSAAAQLSPLVDWADLDGNLLISNDLYEGVKVIDGKLTLNNLPGIGIRKRTA
ncbi:MAG TPA: dipeptide epimerase [Rhodopirellula baltica]|uniref:Dipeptide epimerase n=1 Tax=Rhodopirellula baltica (strain DSM 10527 / NCIMB 13988 / SH1) TaxID=243090 RepID=Q7UJR2_RHOBA|nr:dipeptide epimerase [Rhodopirellula baltica]CAD77170.1 chloromuconate cycloisomerase YkfB1 [Rhodopirellula baltica SH 1]HBE64177.1 dipeptide epimerase [Rhodopirellula baltica]